MAFMPPRTPHFVTPNLFSVTPNEVKGRPFSLSRVLFYCHPFFIVAPSEARGSLLPIGTPSRTKRGMHGLRSTGQGRKVAPRRQPRGLIKAHLGAMGRSFTCLKINSYLKSLKKLKNVMRPMRKENPIAVNHCRKFNLFSKASNLAFISLIKPSNLEFMASNLASLSFL
jgi:hypothetical protein